MAHLPEGKQPLPVPRALETKEIPAVVAEFKTAAQMAKLAGFDGIELHGANGYLIDTFLQSSTNKREDAYGGSIEKRYRFLKEVVEAVLQVFPASRVGVRISPHSPYNDMGAADNREQFLYVAKQLSQFKLAYLHVLIGTGFGVTDKIKPMVMEEFRKVYSGTLIANVGYDRDSGEKELLSGNADLISYGRHYLSNPDLVERFANNWPLNPAPDAKMWFSPPYNGGEGYTEYTPYVAKQEAKEEKQEEEIES